MSDVPTPHQPPGLPQGMPRPVPVLPVEPRPVLPIADRTQPPPYGWPAAAMPAVPVKAARPSAVTVLGAASLVVAFLGIIGSIGTGLAAFAFYVNGHTVSARLAQNAAALGQSPLLAPDPPPAPVETGPDGVGQPMRGALVNAFNRVRPLSPPRLEQLDAMLARHGRIVLLTARERQASKEPQVENVRNLVVDHGELFSTNRSAPPQYFAMQTGRLELYDDRAVFYPADATPTLRSSLVRGPVRRALPEAEVTAALKQARTLARGALTDAQESALTTILSAPDQKLIGPPSAKTPAEPSLVTPGADGAVTLHFSQGNLYLGSKGEVLGAAPPPALPPTPNTAAFVTVMAASLVGFALAITLAVAGVLVLRGLRSGRRLHLAWAGVKVPVTIVGVVAFWWMTRNFYDRFAGYGPPQPAIPLGRAPPGFMPNPWQPLAAGAVALLYPVIVMVLLRSRLVREFFRPTE